MGFRIPIVSDISQGVARLFGSKDDSLRQFLDILGMSAIGYGAGSAIGAGTGAGAAAGGTGGAVGGTEAGMAEVPISAYGATSIPVQAGEGTAVGVSSTAYPGATSPTTGGWEETGVGPEGVSTVEPQGGNPAMYPDEYLYGPEMYPGESQGVPGATSPTTWDKIYGYGRGASKLMGDYPKTTGFLGLTALNALNSMNQARMMKGANESQQKSWQDYLNVINPPESVKAQRYGAAVGDVERTGAQTRERVASQQAARGIRGKGTVASTGDLAEAERMAKNLAYNQVYGAWNVPSGPGPSSYAPSGSQLFGTNAAQAGSYLMPLWMMSQYGNKNANA